MTSKRGSLADLLNNKGYYPPPPIDLIHEPEVVAEEEYHEQQDEGMYLLDEDDHDDNQILFTEEEMPGSSIQVLPNETEALPMFTTTSVLEAEGSESKKNDLIELYGTIAFLKQENVELNKEFHQMKQYYGRELDSMKEKYESELKQLASEGHDLKQQLNAKLEIIHTLDTQNKNLDQEIQAILEDKQMLESRMNGDSSLKAEMMSSKNELNKLKMELIHVHDDHEKLAQAKHFLQQEYQALEKEYQLLEQNENKLKQEFQQEMGNTSNQVIPSLFLLISFVFPSYFPIFLFMVWLTKLIDQCDAKRFIRSPTDDPTVKQYNHEFRKEFAAYE